MKIKTEQRSADSQRIWEDFHGSLRAFVSSRIKQPSDAEDVVQDIFLQIYKNLFTLRDEAQLPAWVFTIARNAIANYFRIISRLPEPLADDFDLPAPIETPETYGATVNALTNCLEPMIEALPKTYRDAVRLTELKGVSQAAAAKQAGLSVSGMKSRVQRGRRKLREKFLECCEIELDTCHIIVACRCRNCGCCPCTSDKEIAAQDE